MASGHRKRKAALVKTSLPAGVTVPASERGNLEHQNNLMAMAVYASGGLTPTFTAGLATPLSDAVSDADGLFTVFGAWLAENVGMTGSEGEQLVYGETSFYNQTTLAFKKWYEPKVGTATTVTAKAAPVLVYSNDGPQAEYAPLYRANAAGTASLSFDKSVTGSLTDCQFFLVGSVLSGDSVNVYYGSATSTTKLNADFTLTSSTPVVLAFSTASAGLLGSTDKLRVVYSSSVGNRASTELSNWFFAMTPVPG